MNNIIKLKENTVILPRKIYLLVKLFKVISRRKSHVFTRENPRIAEKIEKEKYSAFSNLLRIEMSGLPEKGKYGDTFNVIRRIVIPHLMTKSVHGHRQILIFKILKSTPRTYLCKTSRISCTQWKINHLKFCSEYNFHNMVKFETIKAGRIKDIFNLTRKIE